MMQFEIITLFPSIFDSFLQESLMQKAIQKGLLEVRTYNLRNHGLGNRQQVDDAPYGGGAGMVLMVEPIYEALKTRREFYQKQGQKLHVVMLTPQGTRYTQQKAQELTTYSAIALLCGRYEGFDERVRTYVDEEISGGNFICLGGETIAMTIIESVARLLPGFLGNSESLEQESFTNQLLEYPQYTRPQEFRGLGTPDVLLSGNHAEIARWRHEQSVARTELQQKT